MKIQKIDGVEADTTRGYYKHKTIIVSDIKDKHIVFIVCNIKMIDNILKDAVEKGIIKAYQIEE